MLFLLLTFFLQKKSVLGLERKRERERDRLGERKISRQTGVGERER